LFAKLVEYWWFQLLLISGVFVWGFLLLYIVIGLGCHLISETLRGYSELQETRARLEADAKQINELLDNLHHKDSK